MSHTHTNSRVHTCLGSDLNSRWYICMQEGWNVNLLLAHANKYNEDAHRNSDKEKTNQMTHLCVSKQTHTHRVLFESLGMCVQLSGACVYVCAWHTRMWQCHRSTVVPQAGGVTDWGPLCQGEHWEEFIHVQWTEREREGEMGEGEGGGCNRESALSRLKRPLRAKMGNEKRGVSKETGV